jgi:hypothetical protein
MFNEKINNQAAVFTDDFSSGLAIDQGIMLTTGNASLART